MDSNIDHLETEIMTDAERNLKRRTLAGKAAIVGLLSGLVAVGFRLCLEYAEHMRESLLKYYAHLNPFVPALIFVILLSVTALLTRKLAPESSGSGIPHLKGVLKAGFAFRDVRVLLVKFFAGVIGIGSGLALGREGPTVQMGGAMGSIFSRFFGINQSETRLLICAGAGSGLAAAFNAPFAGLLFILEELQHKIDRHSMVVAFSATISANLVCRFFLGTAPIFNLKFMNHTDLKLVLWGILFGILLGFAGLLFNAALMKSIRLFSGHRVFLAISLGMLFGFLGFYYPDLLGIGHNLTEKIMNGELPLKILVWFFIARFVLTILSYNTGIPGGIFAPMLLLGALLGGIFHHVVEYFQPGTYKLAVFFVLGMGGLFSAIVRSPITGVVLIIEMTNEFHLLLPLMIISIIAYAVPEFYSNRPIYDDLLIAEIERRKQEAEQFENLSVDETLR